MSCEHKTKVDATTHSDPRDHTRWHCVECNEEWVEPNKSEEEFGLTAYIQLLDEAQMPEYKTEGSVGFDIAVIEDAIIAPREVVRVRTGLIIKPPKGYWWMVTNRSSNYTRGIMLANNTGIVDTDFCGPGDEYKLSLMNIWHDRNVYIKASDRLAQGIFLPVTRCEFVQTEMTGPSRGGWGSTGR